MKRIKNATAWSLIAVGFIGLIMTRWFIKNQAISNNRNRVFPIY
jgi:hypothetical protein